MLKKGIYYYFLPTYAQAKQVVWDNLINEHLPVQCYERKNDSELAIYYKNGSLQRFVGCEDPDRHAGINPIDVVFDEYSKYKNDKIWTKIVQPILRENSGTATFIFTPEGRNFSFDLLSRARTNPEWFVSVKNVYQTHSHTNKELKEVQKDTPEILFKQEYLCDFLDNASGVFRRCRENVWDCSEINLKHQFQVGVDLAKYNDWTVITPFDLNTWKVMPQDRFNQIDWNLQKARIEARAMKYNNAKVIIDATGVGNPVAEDLDYSGLDVEPFVFTERSKKDLLTNLALKIEQDLIKLPNDEGLLQELESMVYERSDNGKLKMVVPQGMTDDRIMSLALSVWEVKDKAIFNNIIPREKGDNYEVSVSNYDNYNEF